MRRMFVIIHLFRPIEYPAPRVNPNVNCGLWMVMLCQCRFILDKKKKKCIILVSDVDYRVGRLCTCGGKGVREISTSLSIF